MGCLWGSDNFLAITGSAHPFLSGAETFHTPSLGDEEFEIPPIPLDSDVVGHFEDLGGRSWAAGYGKGLWGRIWGGYGVGYGVGMGQDMGGVWGRIWGSMGWVWGVMGGYGGLWGGYGGLWGSMGGIWGVWVV
uniref:Uncharacterized protein n=1 Tax=Melopsittacus undulatus TaxID=13146 RepID=A0A8V5GFY3_MELUD